MQRLNWLVVPILGVLNCHTPPFMEVVGQEGLRGPFLLLLSTHGPKNAYKASPKSNYG